MLLGGCQATRIRVLDDLTGQPVAGATLTPYVLDFFGDPCWTAELTTDAQGRAIIPYRGTLWTIEVSHPKLRQVYPPDKPTQSETESFLYLRRPPRVVLLLPHNYSGPVAISSGDFGDEREPLYRLAMSSDALKPIRVPGLLVTELVRLQEIEAEQDGVAIKPPGSTSGGSGIAVWTPGCTGMFYEGEYVDLLFVGTRAGFEHFQQALREYLHGQSCPVYLNRAILARLGSPAAADARSD